MPESKPMSEMENSRSELKRDEVAKENERKRVCVRGRTAAD